MLSRYVAFHLEVSKGITRIYAELILTAILISKHHPILDTRVLKTNSCINQCKWCLPQSHSSSISTWQHHSLVPQSDASQTLNKLVQRDEETENKSHFVDAVYRQIVSSRSVTAVFNSLSNHDQGKKEARRGGQSRTAMILSYFSLNCHGTVP